jgi:hypothetical protein
VPALLALLSPNIASVLGLGAVGLAIVAVVPLAGLDELQAPTRAERYKREQDALGVRQQAELAKLEAEIEAQRRALNPDSPLKDHLEYVNGTQSGTPEHEQALAGARLAKSRQDDAIKLLAAGKIAWLEEMPLLDIEAAPALCATYDGALRRQATDTESFDNNVAENIERQVHNIRFLVAAHCNLDAGLGAAVARVQKILDKIGPLDGSRPDRTRFRDTLIALRETR